MHSSFASSTNMLSYCKFSTTTLEPMNFFYYRYKKTCQQEPGSTIFNSQTTLFFLEDFKKKKNHYVNKLFKNCFRHPPLPAPLPSFLSAGQNFFSSAGSDVTCSSFFPSLFFGSIQHLPGEEGKEKYHSLYELV